MPVVEIEGLGPLVKADVNKLSLFEVTPVTVAAAAALIIVDATVPDDNGVVVVDDDCDVDEVVVWVDDEFVVDEDCDDDDKFDSIVNPFDGLLMVLIWLTAVSFSTVNGGMATILTP